VSWWYLIPRPTGVQPFDPVGLAWSQGYRLTLPEGTQAAHVAIVRHDGYLMTSLYPAAFHGSTSKRPTYRDRLTIAGGVQAADSDASCYQQIEVLITLGQGTDRSCLTTERRTDGPNRAFDSLTWVGPARGMGKLEAGRWLPIGAFEVEHWLPEDTFERIPFEWVGILLYLGTDDPPTDPPQMTELSRSFPDLRTLERVP
jgi:hypothetical protein